MDNNFFKIHKIFSGLSYNNMTSLFNSTGEKINEVSIFNNDGSFNQELLTKEGFKQNIFANEYSEIDLLDDDEEKATMKQNLDSKYENLYDAIANMDDNPEMSEEELKFIASYGKNSDKNTISRDDFYDLGIVGREINKYTEENNNSRELRQFLSKPETNIISPNKVEKPSNITAVNEKLKINGKIDEHVIQGNVGDCWLLAGINSLNSTDKGKEIIRNSIVPNEDGTVTIRFAGLEKEINITPDEITEHDTDTNFQDNYSNGDNDALVLEIGMRKLMQENPQLFFGAKDISGGPTFNFLKAMIPNYNINYIKDTFETEEISEDGTAVTKSKASHQFSEKIKEVFNQALNNKNIAMGFSTGGHAMAIVSVKENEITYIDSMNYHKTTMSWDEFINRGISNFTYTDLSKQ